MKTKKRKRIRKWKAIAMLQGGQLVDVTDRRGRGYNGGIYSWDESIKVEIREV